MNPWPLPDSAAHTQKSIKEGKAEHHRVAQTYHGYSSKLDKKCLKSRKEAVIIAQLRAGHSTLLAAYSHLLNTNTDPIFDLCKGDDQTLEHWLLECPGTLAHRGDIRLCNQWPGRPVNGPLWYAWASAENSRVTRGSAPITTTLPHNNGKYTIMVALISWRAIMGKTPLPFLRSFVFNLLLCLVGKKSTNICFCIWIYSPDFRWWIV